MKKIYRTLIALLVVTGFVACQEQYEPDMVPGHELAGEWWVETLYGGQVVLGHERVMTYNTAAADGQTIWFDDGEHIWPVKVQLTGNPADLTFTGEGDNIYNIADYDTADLAAPYDSLTPIYYTAKIEGKIITDGGKSKTGVVVDSIWMKASFSDDPGEEYEFAGHRRTGFEEDDY